ncbi:MAG TPA: DUF3014 domain-containing protein [Woeseiaceae bacterium]|nr:DUF3014 domain-containing protein [Woeseiaceae bacterium]
MNRESSQWLIPVLLALAVAAALWFLARQTREPEPPAAETLKPEVQEPLAAERVGPLYPMPDVGEPADESGLRPLPPLDASDEYFRLELTELYGDAIGRLLVESGLIEKIVATVDSLPRAHVAEKIRPVGRLEGEFAVDGQDGSGEYTLSPENYARYDALVQVVTTADIAQVVDTYRRFYPLFQDAYINLGYPRGYFNDRLVEVIDHLLETPEPGEPVTLVRPNVLYLYADAELESRSSGQKLLMRMGAGHAARVKETLREFRAAIANQ